MVKATLGAVVSAVVWGGCGPPPADSDFGSSLEIERGDGVSDQDDGGGDDGGGDDGGSDGGGDDGGGDDGGCDDNDGLADDGSDDDVGPEPHEYIGGYPSNPCDTVPSATGYGVGDISPDFALVDQHGEEVRLSDFCGSVVLLDTSAYW